MIALPANPRILVIVLRRLGDVLTTTPLIRSLKRAWPASRIDAFVFAGTEGMLEGNPDLADIIAIPARPSARELLATLRPLWRRYCLGISTTGSDRATFVAWAGGRHRVGLVYRKDRARRLKRLALHDIVTPTGDPHRINQVLLFADALGIPRCAEVVVPRSQVRPGLIPQTPFAVIHLEPKQRNRRWTVAGWRALAAELARRGLALVATGGPGEEERRYLDEVWNDVGLDVRRLDGRLGWGEIAALLADARLYVGPDTSVTHLAAAVGCPTVALYGPMDPRLWGPWPIDGLAEPWMAAARVQRRGNVWVVQNPLPCLPCLRQGCEDHPDSFSRCLDELTVAQVLSAVDQAIGAAPNLTAVTARTG
jgi:heptosyltransferase-3